MTTQDKIDVLREKILLKIAEVDQSLKRTQQLFKEHEKEREERKQLYESLNLFSKDL